VVRWLRSERWLPHHRIRVGARGERVAARYLRRQRLRIVARNVHVGRGEIDLVALDGETLVFVEVKSRTYREGIERTGWENLDRRKCDALRRSAWAYLRSLEWCPRGYRLDVVTVEFAGPGRFSGPTDVRWHPGAIEM